MFAFRAASGEVIAGPPDHFGFADPYPDAAKVPAGTYLKRHWKVAYEYDFGDGWEHTVDLREVVTSDDKFRRRLLEGSRAFPPEDCGGVPGYEDVLAVASGRAARYHDTEALREWARDWDPEAFDLDLVRKRFDQ